MTVFVYFVWGDYDEPGEVRKVFDSREKAEKWNKRMKEILNLHNKYHRDLKIKGSTMTDPYIFKLRQEAGGENYIGEIVELKLD